MPVAALLPSPCLSLQVWYSAAWTHAAHAAFRTALTSVLLGNDSLDSAVSEMLRHWQREDVPLVTARKEWMASLTRNYADIGTYK